MKQDRTIDETIIAERGNPLPNSEVRIPKPRRKRGGQPGNRNRLAHGGFSQRARERRDWVRALVAETNALIIRVEMVGRARRTLKAKLEKTVIPGEYAAARRVRGSHSGSVLATQVVKLSRSLEIISAASLPAYGKRATWVPSAFAKATADVMSYFSPAEALSVGGFPSRC